MIEDDANRALQILQVTGSKSAKRSYDSPSYVMVDTVLAMALDLDMWTYYGGAFHWT